MAWKHDCAALLANDVELWIDACPHCGKPRDTAPPTAQAEGWTKAHRTITYTCPVCASSLERQE